MAASALFFFKLPLCCDGSLIFCFFCFCSRIEYLKDAVRLLVSRDMHVCATFARRFYWSDLNLWPEDLEPGSVVLLSGKDDLMDAAEVKDMLDVAGHVKVRNITDWLMAQGRDCERPVVMCLLEDEHVHQLLAHLAADKLGTWNVTG